MKSRIYYLLLAVMTAAFLTACDNTDTTTENDMGAPAAGSAGGVGTNDPGATTGAEGTTSPDPATEIPGNTDSQTQDPNAAGTTDPSTTNTNP